MKYKFSEIVDLNRLKELMETFYEAAEIPSVIAILDSDGNILVSVGWRNICTKFHRVNRETEQLCKISDKYINNYLDSERPYIWYKCANGLIDAAAPIIINGVHLATIFTGQFFFERPDIEQFRQKARKFGFDEEEYLSALANVPVITKDKLDSTMNYFIMLAQILAQMGMTNITLLESNTKVLEEDEKRLKTILNNTPNVAIRNYDINGNVLFWNDSAKRIFERTHMEDSLDKFVFNGETHNIYSKILQDIFELNQPVGPVEWNFKNKEGIEKTMYSTIFPIFFEDGKKEFVCMDVDISERKKFEKEIARIEQLHLVGEMAAGIGHEVRNPMTSVRGFLQLLSGKDDCSQYKEFYDIMIKELDRANAIITEFLSLSKNKTIKLTMKNLNSIIKSLAPLIEANAHVFGQNLNLELDEIPDLLLDESEMRQLILNLNQNSMEAMSPGGCVTIKTYIDNNEAVLAVQDQGKGIPSDIIDKLGTPFFSRKDNGTGLGLAVCYSIAARHNAKISVQSGKEGTTFFVRFIV